MKTRYFKCIKDFECKTILGETFNYHKDELLYTKEDGKLENENGQLCVCSVADFLTNFEEISKEEATNRILEKTQESSSLQQELMRQFCDSLDRKLEQFKLPIAFHKADTQPGTNIETDEIKIVDGVKYKRKTMYQPIIYDGLNVVCKRRVTEYLFDSPEETFYQEFVMGFAETEVWIRYENS